MGRDRLQELRAKSGIPDGNGDAGGANFEGANGAGGPVYNTTVTDGGTVSIQMEDMQNIHEMELFFKQLEDLRKINEDLKADVKNVKAHQSDILAQPIPDEKKKQELDQLMAAIKTRSGVVKGKLKGIETRIKQMEQEEDDSSPASLRIKKTQHASILREFVEIMNEYQKAQVDYRDRCKARIKRQLNITETSFNDDEVENMIEEGNFSVFTQGILVEAEQARQMLADVEARHNDLVKLEKSLKELHDLFMEMAMLVESQGELVDRIENQVSSTREYTAKAKEQLKEAVVLQTKARKKKIWIIIILIIICLVLGLIIYFSLR